MTPLLFLLITGSVVLVTALVVAYIGYSAKRDLDGRYANARRVRRPGEPRLGYGDDRVLT